MGCDIHAHIEYQPYEHEWWGFAALQGEPRHYTLFGALTDGEVRGDAISASVPPRGYPTDASYDTNDDYYENAFRGDLDSETADATVEEWRKELPSTAVVDHDGAHTTAAACWPDPDWHTPSWLTTDEFLVVLTAVDEHDQYWDAVVAMMQTLEKHGTPARIVFWFDN